MFLASAAFFLSRKVENKRRLVRQKVGFNAHIRGQTLGNLLKYPAQILFKRCVPVLVKNIVKNSVRKNARVALTSKNMPTAVAAPAGLVI
jgi:hypothetical protein